MAVILLSSALRLIISYKLKKYIRRIRDNVEYSDFEKKRVQDPATGWMVADSYPASLRSYNEMVDDYNRLR